MLSVVLGRAQFWVILAGCLCLAQGNDKDCEDSLSDHDKNAICNKAVTVNGFCCDSGEADKGCQEMASTVKGSSPKCSSKNLCTFSKDGKTVYISSKDDPKQNTIKDCMKNVRIIDKPGGGGGGGGDDKDHNKGGGGNTPAPKGGGGGDHHNGGGGGNTTPPSNGGGGGNPHNGGGGGGGNTTPPPKHKGDGGDGGNHSTPPPNNKGGGGGGNNTPTPPKSGGGAPTTPCD